MDVRKIVGRNVNMIREKRGLTREEVALSAGISVSCLRAIELGRKACRIGTLKKIADSVEVSVDWLLSEKIDSFPGVSESAPLDIHKEEE